MARTPIEVQAEKVNRMIDDRIGFYRLGVKKGTLDLQVASAKQTECEDIRLTFATLVEHQDAVREAVKASIARKKRKKEAEDRALPDTKILGAKFRRDAKGWSVCFVVRVEVQSRRVGDRCIGLDMGIVDLAIGDGGQRIPNQCQAKRAARELRLRQRALARCKRGSAGRRKARAQVARVHAKIANTRSTYLHQQAADLVANYDLIAVEKLAIKNMSRSASGTTEKPGTNVAQKSGLNRAISDAAWGRFIQLIDYKAERAGVEVIKVNPKYTSQTCPCCGHVAAENRPTRDRFHCLKCAFDEDADIVGARNILARTVVGPGAAHVAHRSKRSPGNIMPRQEERISK